MFTFFFEQRYFYSWDIEDKEEKAITPMQMEFRILNQMGIKIRNSNFKSTDAKFARIC